jgi:hypothetical protein
LGLGLRGEEISDLLIHPSLLMRCLALALAALHRASLRTGV